jgi:asparagine synthase (glutamine-hydrolysing)
LPSAVAALGMQGFGIPVSIWFRGELSIWIRDILLELGTPLRTWFNRHALEEILSEHTSCRAGHGKCIYASAMLGLWANDS